MCVSSIPRSGRNPENLKLKAKLEAWKLRYGYSVVEVVCRLLYFLAVQMIVTSECITTETDVKKCGKISN